MNTFMSFVSKESRHILRDRRTLLILIGMPIVMMLLFGFAITTEVRNVRLIIVTSSMDNATQRISDRLNASEYFNVTSCVSTADEAKKILERGSADMSIVLSPRFSNHIYDGSVAVQIIADCADPNMAIQQSNYVRQIIMAEMMKGGVKNGGSMIKLLYNPRMESAYNFVPGVMGMILMIICAMMTSISIVREKERGTMELLLVSPMNPLLLIVAKTVPYFVLSLINLATILLLSVFLLGVPIVGSLGTLIVFSLIFLFVNLALGLLISSVAGSQMVALLV